MPVVEAGSRVVVLGRPEFYLNRGTLSLRKRSFATSESASCSPGSIGSSTCSPPRDCSRRPQAALPFLPSGVGLVCGRGSAAEHDVLENAARRWPAVRFTVKNVPVQGPTPTAR